MQRMFVMDAKLAAAATALFIGGTFVIEPLLAPYIGGSAAYAPALIAIAGVGVIGMNYNKGAAKMMLLTACVFAVSLTLRTLDMPLCAQIPIGLHYFWHTLNALTLALVLETLRLARKP